MKSDLSRLKYLINIREVMIWLYLFTAYSFLCMAKQVIDDDRPARYVLYDVNPGEGFNLRRDVYMRMAVFVR